MAVVGCSGSHFLLLWLRFLVIDVRALAGRRVTWLVTVDKHLQTRKQESVLFVQHISLLRTTKAQETITQLQCDCSVGYNMDVMVSSNCIGRVLMTLLFYLCWGRGGGVTVVHRASPG